MKTFKRLLSSLIFYPMLVLWFIPRQKYIAWKKAEFEYVYGPNPEDPNLVILLEKKKRPYATRKAAADMFFNTELQVALAGHRRASSKKERKAVYNEHLKAIKNSQEDEIFKELGIKDE